MHKGPLTIDLLKTLLPFDDHEFFLCGPPGFMQALYDGLRDLGVRDERIQAEAFGPSSLKRRPDGAAGAGATAAPAAKQATVTFTRSGDAAEWTPERGTLLEFAEGKGLSPPFSCRAGHCGSCATRMTAGARDLRRAHGLAAGRRRSAAVLRLACGRRRRSHRTRPVSCSRQAGDAARGRFMATHRIHPVIDKTFAFDDTPAAYARLKSASHFGKLVIELG